MTLTRSLLENFGGIGMEDIPNEVLQKIFDSFETKSELLKVRMVCRRWASNASEVLGNRTNAQFREWNPVLQSPDKKEYFVQKVMIPTYIYTKFSERDIIFPHNLVKELNPFPTLSVSLVAMEREREFDERHLKPGEIKISLLPLLRSHGANLKTLSLDLSSADGFVIEPQILLSELPNLKSLRMKTCATSPLHILSQTKSPPTKPVKMLTTLKNLALIICDEDLTDWLIQTCSSNLETLELDCISTQPFIRERKSKPEAFKKLTSLKLFGMDKKFMVEEEFELQLKNLNRLSVNWSLGSPEHVSRFISMHRETLIELCFCRDLFEDPLFYESNGHSDDKRRITFPRINKLCLLFVVSQHPPDMEMITMSFPNLKILQLVYSLQLSKERMHDFCHISDFLQSCPHINRIEVLYCHCFIENELVHCHTYDRENM
ncbi:unnamed protein product [Orchesella dallaii]|uniref:F-box domain-containing protein n=1 Tax=Orchesella dallaii TaxID=48710 RepID=A0ABP1R5D3_9HEXA